MSENSWVICPVCKKKHKHEISKEHAKMICVDRAVLEKFEEEMNHMIDTWTRLLDTSTTDQQHQEEVKWRLSELKVMQNVMNHIRKEYNLQ